MAKKDKKKDKKKDNSGADPVGAVRSAVEKTYQATAGGAQSTRTRAQDLVDEVAAAAVRVREMIEQVGVLEDLKGLRGEVEKLARRVAALEGGRSAATSRPTTTASKPAARKTAARKPAARKTAARKTATRKTATRKTAARKPAASKPAASKPAASTRKPSTRTTAAKKPSAS